MQETGVQFQVESYQRLKKWYLMSLCLPLSIITYGSRVSGAITGKESHTLLHLGVIAIEKVAFWSPSTTVGPLTDVYMGVNNRNESVCVKEIEKRSNLKVMNLL